MYRELHLDHRLTWRTHLADKFQVLNHCGHMQFSRGVELQTSRYWIGLKLKCCVFLLMRGS